MKKIILGIVFVFASLTLESANTINQVPAKCGEMAQAAYDDALEAGASYEEAYNISETIYQTCKWLSFIAEHLED